MKNQKSVQLFEASEIQSRIVAVRNVQVMLDRDLAVLYGVQTKVLNQAVKRNIEQGVAMLSAVLRSKIAIDVSIRIMDAFVAMRRFSYDHAGLVQRVGAIELKQLETDKRIDTVFDALDRGNLLPSGILPAESEFDSMRYVSRLIESAQSEIVLIDPYSDAVTLEVLSKKRSGVKVRLVCKDRGKPTQTEIAKFNRQYKGLAVTYSDDFHDRFLIIDNIELHGLGSSINCLGRRVTSYTTRDAREIAKLLAMVP